LVCNKLEDIFTPLRFIGVVDWATYHTQIVSSAKEEPKLASQRAHVSIATSRRGTYDQVYLRQVMLRRTHSSTVDGQSAMSLPRRTDHISTLTFGHQENALYTSREAADRALLLKWYNEGGSCRIASDS
jgi:hypothetical protein